MSTKTPREKHNESEDRRFKKVANAAGYVGQPGGWIYKKIRIKKKFYAEDGETIVTREVDDLKCIAQGWRHFESLYASRLGFVRAPFKE